jgi:phage protein D
MFNYVNITFATKGAAVPPERISSFVLQSDRYAHEIAIVKFRDWEVPYEAIKPGTPVLCVLKSPEGKRNFYSYVHHVNPSYTPGKRFTTVVLIGASYVMKQARQKIFTNVTADQVVKKIAASHGFAAEAEPHPRVYDQIAQAGHTDLELMVRLAKQSGYSFRIKDTTVYFRPQAYDYDVLKTKAPTFVMRSTGDPTGSTLYAFNLTAGESIFYRDSMKAAVAVSGVDPLTLTALSYTNQNRSAALRENQTSEVFDRFATDITAPGFAPAFYEALAADARNKYPYRAKIVVTGHPEITPDMPVYLDGLGTQYSGYWIALNVEHKVSEFSLNEFNFTTTIEVGADSLGQAKVTPEGNAARVPNVNTSIMVSPTTAKKRSVNRTVLTS